MQVACAKLSSLVQSTVSLQQYQAACKSSVFPAEGGVANLQVRTSLVLEPTELSLR